MKWLGMTALAWLLFVPSALAQGTEAQRFACEEDAYKWCPYDIPDPDAISACLQRNIRWISPACQAQFGYRAKRR
jgi:hypothetical protein